MLFLYHGICKWLDILIFSDGNDKPLENPFISRKR